MEIKIKHILFVILVLIIGVVSFVIIQKINVVKNENFESIDVNVEETTYSEYVYYGPDSYTSWELGYEVAKKNGDWSRLPLTNEFRKKYNEKDGILGDFEFEKIELAPFDNNTEYSDKYYFVNRNCYFVISNGKEKIAYIYNLKYDGELLSDVLIKDICNLTNEFGEELNVNGYAITNNNFKDSMDFLARGGNDEKSVAVTSNFHKKSPYFLDLFIHYSPLGANEIRFNGGNFEDRIANFIVDSRLECVKREYEVKFKLDEQGHLDDAEVRLKSEKPYKNEKLVKAYDAVFYKNSNWDCLRLTDSFRNKYRSEEGVFKDIDLIDYNVSFESIIFNKNFIKRYQYKDGTCKWFYQNFVYKDNDYLDDVEFIPIDYNGTDAKRAKEIYLKSINR